jgi:hypothetical protein
MHHPVNYDFPVADELVRVLKVANSKVARLIGLRQDQRNSLLGDPDSGDSWRGGKRHVFEGDLSSQQKALHTLAADLLVMLGDVHKTTEKALALSAETQ